MLKSILEYLPLILFVLITKYFGDLLIFLNQHFAGFAAWLAQYYGNFSKYSELALKDPSNTDLSNEALRAATIVLVAFSLIQALIYRLKGWKLSSMQKWGSCSVIILGLLSLLFHNPMIIKMKPTILFGLFGLIGLGIAKWKNINWIEKMYREAFSQAETPLPASGHVLWGRFLNEASAFFMVLAIMNAFVAWYAQPAQWATFKVFGLSFLTLIFFAHQGFRVMKAAEHSNS